MFITYFIHSIVFTSPVSHKRKNSCPNTLTIEKSFKNNYLEEQDFNLSEFLTADTGLFLINADNKPLDIRSDVVNKYGPSNYPTSEQSKSTLASPSIENKKFKVFIGETSTPDATMENSLNFIHQEQIKKQANAVYEIVTKLINELNSGHLFYRYNLISINSLSLSFDKLIPSSKHPKNGFGSIDNDLLIIMKDFMINSRNHVVKFQETDFLILDNSLDMQKVISALMFKMKTIAGHYRKNIDKLGDCIILIYFEFVKLHKWHHLIPEILILYSKVSSVSDRHMLMVLARALNIYLEDKKGIELTDRAIIFCLCLKTKSPALKNLRSDCYIKNMAIKFNIANNKKNQCSKRHIPIMHVFTCNVFQTIRNGIRQRFSMKQRSYYLTYEQLRHVLVSMCISIYEQLGYP